ncbi:MAG: hypothetical protein RRZ93_05040, partial [Ruthenibacterium sp.]
VFYPGNGTKQEVLLSHPLCCMRLRGRNTAILIFINPQYALRVPLCAKRGQRRLCRIPPYPVFLKQDILQYCKQNSISESSTKPAAKQ